MVAGVSVLAVVLIAGAVFVQRRAGQAEPRNMIPAETPATARPETAAPENHATRVRTAEAVSEKPPAPATAKAVLPHADPVASPSPVPRTASPYARSLISNLANLDPRRGALTPEQAQAWKGQFDQLVKSGPEGVVAIREFLNSNLDLKLATVAGGEQLGVPSLRDAMFDALRQIGGGDAAAAAVEAMQASGSPREIARLARDLEEMNPGQYQEAALAAARLALLRAGQNTAAVDTSPLFEVFQRFGDANAAADLEKASTQWNYYGPAALASLAEGAGIAALTRVAQNADGRFGGSSQFAWRMLAEMAPQYPEAAKALLEQVANRGIPAAAWPGIVAALSGERTYYGEGLLNAPNIPANATNPKNFFIVINQQNLRSFNVTPGWTPEQFQRQLELITQLRAANPEAANQLEAANQALAAKPAP